MVNRTLTNRFALTGAAALLCIMAALIVLWAWGPVFGSADTDWPELTMYYETSGDYHSAASSEQTLKYKLAYVDKHNWQSTVVDAPTLNTGGGTFSQVGSYVEVRDGRRTIYEVSSNSSDVLVLEEGEIYIPAYRLTPIAFRYLKENNDAPPVSRSTSVKLCYDGVCDENATGWAFAQERGVDYIYADDKRGIPLQLPGITITEIAAAGAKQPVE